MDARYDAIYLSPHLDDAALSCGGQIYRFTRSGQRVLVVTFMTGTPEGGLSPAAVELHGQWGFPPEEGIAPVLAARRREDEEACRTLGTEHHHAGLIDALYRRRPRDGEPFYPTVESIFGPLVAEDAEVQLGRIAEAIAALPRASRVCGPFGIGNHVDHVLVRRAAERVFGRDLEYYEDYPYAHSWKARWKAFGWRTPQAEDGTPLRREKRTWTLGHDAIEAKCRAVARYTSQIPALFRDQDEMEHKVRVYARRVGGERVWWLVPRR